MQGFKRIRKSYRDEAEAVAKEAEITKAVETFGHWPVKKDAKPLPTPLSSKKTSLATDIPNTIDGTIKEAATLALKTHWAGKRYAAKVPSYVDYVVTFLTQSCGKRNLDDLITKDIDDLVAKCRADKNSASTINAKLSALRVIFKVAAGRTPPLCSRSITIKRVPASRAKKWWLNLENLEKALAYCRKEAGLMILGDYIEFICNSGIRVEEALRARKDDFENLGKVNHTKMLVDGTKTEGARKWIALNETAAAIARRRLRSCDVLFPISYGQLAGAWNDVRSHLGFSDVPTATLKALRRTFAKITELRGMPTSMLQRILRHQSITTTQGYLDLVGTNDEDAARRYL
nr:tyrosine-type recombinase/integrase [Aestuariivirga sp. YIM B02566]